MTGDPPYIVRRPRYVLAMLTLIYLLGFLDRQIVNILAEPIKHDLGLSDGQLGALTGFSFALFYTVLGVPIARLADRFDRGRIIAAALFVWSAFTALCGLAGGFATLFAARVGVGVGEAGCNPPASSLIADIVPKARRASAMAVYALGNPLGSLLGLAVGGLIAANYGWRAAFIAAGIPGVLVALVVLTTIRDPRSAAPADVAGAVPPWRATLAELLRGRAFRLVAFAAAAMAFLNYGKVAFYGSFFLRNHTAQLEAAALAADLRPMTLLGLLLGGLIGISGGIGTLVGGRIADRAARSDPSAYVLIPAVAAVAQMPFFLAALFVGDLWLALGLLGLAAVMTSMWFGPVFAVCVGLATPRTRGIAIAVMQLVTNLVGLGFGPLMVGMLSDLFAGDGAAGGASLRLAMASGSAAGLVAAALFLLARAPLRRELRS